MPAFIKSCFRKLPPGIQARLQAVRSRLPLTAAQRWIRSEYTPFAADQRKQIYLSIARFLHVNRPVTGYYMEFGSHECNTMRMAWDCFHHLLDLEYIAFDSFEGLPEITPIDEQEIWEKGKLSTAQERFLSLCAKHGMPNDKITTVKGFYEHSLTETLRKQLSHKKAAVIYVDCDLYASTVPVLDFCKSFLQQGTVIVFDDWNCFWASPDKGERLAWREFRERNPHLHFEDFFTTGMQKAFVYTGETSHVTPV